MVHDGVNYAMRMVLEKILDISVHFRDVIFIEQRSGLHLFELFVDARVFREVEETGGFVVEAIEQSEFSFFSEESMERSYDIEWNIVYRTPRRCAIRHAEIRPSPLQKGGK